MALLSNPCPWFKKITASPSGPFSHCGAHKKLLFVLMYFGSYQFQVECEIILEVPIIGWSGVVNCYKFADPPPETPMLNVFLTHLKR